MNKTLVSLVLPVYRQADHITAVVEEYHQALTASDIAFEILLVVNGPDDGTWDACAAATTRPGVRALKSDPAGWGNAVRAGIAQSRGDLICYTNSARTTAQDLMRIVTFGLANPGVVVKATRKIRESFMRRAGSLLYNLECRALFNLQYWDINGTPKMFPRSHALLLALTRPDDLIDLEFCVICSREHYPVLEISGFSSRRHGGQSTTRLASAMRMYMGAWRLAREMRKPHAHA